MHRSYLIVWNIIEIFMGFLLIIKVMYSVGCSVEDKEIKSARSEPHGLTGICCVPYLVTIKK
jgi:hypothetical protein